MRYFFFCIVKIYFCRREPVDLPIVFSSNCRFMTWVQQSTSYSVHCNILGFIYLKRMRAARVILTMNNWRGMWLGSIILAQKVWDDVALRTSSFASVLPGVTKTQLKALELKVFTLLNFSTHVKPSLYARAYYDIRTIFKTILTEYEGGVAWRRPLSVKRAKALFGGADVSETNPGTDTPRRDLKPLLLPALKGAASKDSVTSGDDCYSQAGMKKGAYVVDNSCSDCSLTASHSHEFEPSGHSGNVSHNTSSVKLPTLMLSGAPSMVSTPKPVSIWLCGWFLCSTFLRRILFFLFLINRPSFSFIFHSQYDPESYASDIASSFKSTSTGTSYTLPTMSTGTLDNAPFFTPCRSFSYRNKCCFHLHRQAPPSPQGQAHATHLRGLYLPKEESSVCDQLNQACPIIRAPYTW